MSNRNFDNSVIIKRLQDKNYARNLYLNNTNGKTVINNPQNSNGDSSQFTSYIPGAQTEYFRGLLGGQDTVNIGGIVNIPPFPTILTTSTAPSLTNTDNVINTEEDLIFNTDDTITSPDTFNAPNTPTLVYAIPADSGAYIYFTADTGGGLIENYEYIINDGLIQSELNPIDILSPVYIPGLINGTEYSIKLRAINNSNNSTWSNTIIVTPSNDTIPPAVLMFDPNNNSSYSGTGMSVNNIGTYGTLTGTKGSSVIYEDDITISRKIFNFSGSIGNANVITFPQFNFGTTVSVTAWIYPRNKANINGLLVNAGANVPTNGFKFQWNWWNTGSRTIGMQAGNGTQGTDNFTVQNTINYGEWQHIGYVFDQLNRKIIFFKNGIPVDMLSGIEPVANIGTNQAFNIGGYIGGSYTMNANLGYIKVFNTLLNASEILSDFNNSKSQFGL